jgi:hypothetical protein
MKVQNNNSVQDQDGNSTKPLLCDVTLKFILEDVNLRMEILRNRDDSMLNTARMHETTLMQVYLQDMILANIT